MPFYVVWIFRDKENQKSQRRSFPWLDRASTRSRFVLCSSELLSNGKERNVCEQTDLAGITLSLCLPSILQDIPQWPLNKAFCQEFSPSPISITSTIISDAGFTFLNGCVPDTWDCHCLFFAFRDKTKQLHTQKAILCFFSRKHCMDASKGHWLL